MDDITPLTSVSTSTPEEAANNIQNASIFSIDPTNDRNVNSRLTPEAKQTLMPNKAEAPVTDYMSQSTEHTAIASGEKDGVSDIPKLNYVSRLMQYFGDKIGGQYTVGERTADLAAKKMMNDGKLSNEDAADLWNLNQQKDDLAKRNYDIDGPERPPQDIGDIDLESAAKGVVKFGTDAVAGGINFFRGAAKGAYEGAVNSAPGDIQGTIINSTLGALGFKHMVGATYNELPDNMDESTKRHISIGVGAVHAGVNAAMTVGGGLVSKALPFLGTELSPKFVAMTMEAPENAVVRMAINNIGHSAVMMGGAAGVEEASNLVKEEMVKNYDGTSSSFVNALASASQKIATNKDKYLSRLGEATLEGAATGGLFALAGNIAGAGKMRSQVDAIAGMGQDFLDNLTVTRTGSPAGLIEGEAPPREQFKPGQPSPPERPPMKDVTPSVGDEVPAEHMDQKARESLEFHQALHDVNDVMTSTKMNDVAPQESRAFMQKVFERAGLKNLYMTMTGAREFGVDPEKVMQLKNIVDIAKAHVNTPMQVDSAQVMSIASKHPEILQHVFPRPDDASPLQAKTHLENRSDAEEKRQELLSSLGIKPEDVQPDANEGTNVSSLPGKKTAEKVPYDFEGAARETKDVLGWKKNLETQIQQWNDELQSVKEIDKSRGVTGIDIKDVKKSLETRIEGHQKTIDEEILPKLAKLKDEVTKATKTAPPATLLFGHWPEPGIEDTTSLANAHLDAPTFPDALKKHLPEAEVNRIEAANQRAKIDRLTATAEAAKYEMDKVQDINAEQIKQDRIEEELARIAHDPNYKIVDQLRSSIKSAKANKVVSPLQIDPKTLTNEQLKFVDHFRMKEHRVFTKGGATADDVAQLVGLKDGNELLSVLAKTPTREQVARARAKANAITDEQNVRSVDDLNHVKIIEEIRNEAKNNLEWMKFMKDQEWPATKSAIKRIALPLPKIEELEHQARVTISKTKVGDLNERQYEVGEARSNRLAISALLKGDIVTAFQAKQAAAQNALLRKETMLQTNRTNRAIKFFRNVGKPANQELLKDAGPLISGAMQELRDLWNFNPKAPKQLPEGIQGTFEKWALKSIKDGHGDFTFPEALTDLRQSVKDMTVEQLLVVHDRGRVILREAKMQNKFIKHEDASAKAEHEEDVARVVAKSRYLLQNHPAFDPDRVAPKNDARTIWQNSYRVFSEIENLIAGKQNIYRELDQGGLGEHFYKTFDSEIEGSGENFEKTGFTYVRKLLRGIDRRLEESALQHGSLEKVNSKFIDIPEFKDIKNLNYGKNFTKGDLMRAYAYRAQEYTRDLLIKNNGASEELWQQVLDRELDEKDVQHMHDVGAAYDSLKPEIEKVQKADGRETDWVEGVDITHRGVTRKGFYNPAQYEHEYTQAIAKDAADFLDKVNDDKMKGIGMRQYSSEHTKQGYLTSRVGNNEPLDLSLERVYTGLSQSVHDLAYRFPLRNFFELMSDKDLVKDMIAVVGEPKVKNLINNNLEMAARPASKDEGFQANATRIMRKGFDKLGSNFATYSLWGKSSVVIKQFEATSEMFNILGPKAMIHAASVNLQMIGRIDKIEGYIGFVRRLDPSFQKYFEDLNDNAISSTRKLIPSKGVVPGKVIGEKTIKYTGKAKDIIDGAHEMGVSAGFFPVSATDAYLKTWQALTAFKTFTHGDFPGWPLERIQQMSEEEQFHQVQMIIQQMSTITQIQNKLNLKAPIQRISEAKSWTYFWNYPRNIINNTLLDLRKTRWQSSEGWKKFEDGDTKGASKSFAGAGSTFLSRAVWSYIGGTIAAFAAGKAIQGAKKSINNASDLAEAGAGWFGDLMEAPFEHAMTVTPGINSMKHALDSKRKYARAEVTTPETQMASSIATCYRAVKDMMDLGRDMSSTRIRACLEAESFVFYPLPVGAGYKAMKWLNESQAPSEGSGLMSMNHIEGLLHDMKDFVSNPPKDVDPKFVDSIKDLHDQLAVNAAEVPAGTSDAIKNAISGGDWKAPNGVYGFTPTQWKGIQAKAPELGLTDAGRIAKDTSQQEKAIEWSLNDSAHQLTEKDLPVTKDTLFGVHTLGLENYEKLFKAPNDTKLKTVFGSDFLEKTPEIGQFKTVGQVKGYLTKMLDHGKNAANLTQPTAKAED
jgi:hypothetical protein